MAPFMKSRGQVTTRDKGRTSRAPNDKPRASPGRSASLIYGLLPVLEALRAEGRRIDKVLIADGARERRISELIALCRERSIAWRRVPRDMFSKYLDAGVNHQGVMAFSASADYVELETILDSGGDATLVVVLDGVEDPRNLGAILRVAECAGADGIVI